MKTILTNARVVTPEWDDLGSVVVEDGRIVEVVRGRIFSEGLDLCGQWLTPGCIDIHSDYLERELHPRPSANFSLPLAFHFMDQRAITCGLTMVFSAISFTEDQHFNRKFGDAVEQAKHIDDVRNDTMGRHYLHARLDPNTNATLEYLDALHDIDSLTMVVYNDSIPGQRQFNMEQTIKMRVDYLNVSEEEAIRLIEEKIVERSAINNRGPIMEAFQGKAILGSHDDTLVEHIDEAKEFGCTLSEMPTTIEAARRAKEEDLLVCMGAPNYVRGGSHCGNLACSDAMDEDLVDIICSDYHFPSILGSVIKMVDNGISPSRAFDFVALNPARLIEMDQDLGSIKEGKVADLVAFHPVVDHARVSHVWVDGEPVYQAQVKSVAAIQENLKAG